MSSSIEKKIQETLQGTTLEREKYLYNVLGESLADRLFLYFHSTVDFAYDENGDGAFVECNLPYLFASLCLAIESAGTNLFSVRMSADESYAEIRLVLSCEGKPPQKEIYENAILSGVEYRENKDGISLFLPLTREVVLHLFANRESLLQKLNFLAKSFGIL